MVRTPLPGWPIICPHAPLYSTSDDALEWSPSLSLRRMTMKPLLREPSGNHRGTRKHDRPSGVFASVRNASHIGADVNHLWPVSEYGAPGPVLCVSGAATVVLERTSEPPCFSVMDMPTVQPRFSHAGTSRGSYLNTRRSVHRVVKTRGTALETRRKKHNHSDACDTNTDT
jgi:hypothetical protein